MVDIGLIIARLPHEAQHMKSYGNAHEDIENPQSVGQHQATQSEQHIGEYGQTIRSQCLRNESIGVCSARGNHAIGFISFERVHLAQKQHCHQYVRQFVRESLNPGDVFGSKSLHYHIYQSTACRPLLKLHLTQYSHIFQKQYFYYFPSIGQCN